MSKRYWVAASLALIVVVGLLVWCPPRGSADLAAWVQAIGSIAAVGVAIWITHKGEADKRKAAWLMANLYASNLLAMCATLRDAAGLGQTEVIRRTCDQLEELTEWGRRIDVMMLLEKSVIAHFEMRAVAAATLGRANAINALMYDYKQASHFFETQRERVHKASADGFWLG